jgi:hypothetical protein
MKFTLAFSIGETNHKVCQWLAGGWWFSPGTPVSSINKTGCHDIIEILCIILCIFSGLILVHLYYRGIILCIFSGLILVHLYYRGIILCIFSGLILVHLCNTKRQALDTHIYCSYKCQNIQPNSIFVHSAGRNNSWKMKVCLRF